MKSWSQDIAPNSGAMPRFGIGIVLIATLVAVRHAMAPWVLMWALSLIIFAEFKWLTWRKVTIDKLTPEAHRTLGYFLGWPGMDAARFLAAKPAIAPPRRSEWLLAAGKMLGGIGLLWGGIRWIQNPWLAGWIGMVGLILLLHFGLFQLLALFWQSRGIDARPLMNRPTHARSISDFWGRRWNSAFRDLAFGLLFSRLVKKLGIRWATLATFVVSGLIHELVITVPAGGGYGGPTLYFTIQGIGLIAERTAPMRALIRSHPWLGRTFAWVVIVLPVFALFPRSFVLRIMIPFFQAIHAFP